MKRALLIAGAPVPGHEEFYHDLARSAAHVVAVDSGVDLCHSAARVPDLVVGDLDSADESALAWAWAGGAAALTAPVHKDVSDLDLALAECSRQGFERVTVTAAWSGRLDHTLAALGSLVHAEGVVVDLRDPGLVGWLLDPATRGSIGIGPAGASCSLFALGTPACVTTSGLRYPLTAEELAPLSSRGLSNVVAQAPARVTVHRGVVLALSNPLADGTLAHPVDAAG